MMIDFLYIFLVMKEKVISGRLANFKRKSWYQDCPKLWGIFLTSAIFN